MQRSSKSLRIAKDMRQLARADDLHTIAIESIDDMDTTYHGNMRPKDGPYAGCNFHFEMTIPEDYPISPPKISLMCYSLRHPNVFNFGNEVYICLSMLRPSAPGVLNWSSSYTIKSVLMQLQSFLFAENVEQDYGGSVNVGDMRRREHIDKTIQETRRFRCATCGHCGTNPYPVVNDIEFLMRDQDFPPLRSCVPCEPIQQAAVIGGRFGAVNDDVMVDSIIPLLEDASLKYMSESCVQMRRLMGNAMVWRRRDLVCYHSKESFRDTVLGVPVMVTWHPDGGLKRLSTLDGGDLIGESAYRRERIRLTSNCEPFNFWFPVALDPQHWENAQPLLKRQIMSLTSTLVDPLGRRLHYTNAVLMVMSKLMNSTVVELMNNSKKSLSRHMSDQAIEGYSLYHHMLLKLCEANPGIAYVAQCRVNAFMQGTTDKKAVPDMGDFIACLTVCNTTWKDVAVSILREVFTRQIYWICKDDARIADVSITTAERLAITMKSQKTSLRLLMFQVAFLNLIGRPAGQSCQQLISRYDKGIGAVKPRLRQALQTEAKHILKVTKWTAFFERVQVAEPTPDFLGGVLTDALHASFSAGYCRPGCRPRRRHDGR